MAEAAPGGGPPPRDQPPPDKKDPVPVIEYRRVVYLIPNLFTALALLLGFYAIFKAVDGEFQTAGLAIIIASVMDAMDGRVARMINAESAFGAQFDSLSDALCFGLAPVVLAHQWGLHEFGRIGFIAGFFFCAAAIIRLARFNISHGLVDPRYFSGLPSPLAGILVASLVLVVGTEPSLGEALLVMLTMLVISATMVSDFRFYSFKDINLRARVQTPAMMLAVLVAFAFITLMLLEFGVLAILLFCLAYLASGFAISSRYLLRRLKRFFRGLSASDFFKEMASLREERRERRQRGEDQDREKPSAEERDG